MLWRYLLLTVGVFSTSMSVILIRMSPTQPVVLSALRLLLAGGLLLPVFLHEWRGHGRGFTAAHWRCTLAPSLLLALHFSSWSYGARLTGTAQASLIVNLVPVAMPFLLHWLVRERINRIEIAGTAIALGEAVKVASDRVCLQRGITDLRNASSRLALTSADQPVQRIAKRQ